MSSCFPQVALSLPEVSLYQVISEPASDGSNKTFEGLFVASAHSLTFVVVGKTSITDKLHWEYKSPVSDMNKVGQG